MRKHLILSAVFLLFFALGFGLWKIFQEQTGVQHTSGSPVVFLIWVVGGLLAIQTIRLENRLLWSKYYEERKQGASRYDFAPISYGFIIGVVSAIVFYAR